MRFYDRVNEMQILQENEAQAERSAVFTVLMGRRRVGKTSLITHAMDGREYAYLLKGASRPFHFSHLLQ